MRPTVQRRWARLKEALRNLKEEFLKPDQYLDEPAADLKEYIRWYNNKRYCMVVGTFPAALYDLKKVTDLGATRHIYESSQNTGAYRQRVGCY